MSSSQHARRPRLLTLAPVVATALLLAACFGGTEVEPEPDPDPGAPAEGGVVLTPVPGATDVNVLLTEWAVAADPATVRAGETYFLANNAGGEAHELVIVRTDLAPDSLPTDDSGRVPEDEIDIVAEIEPFAAGSQASISLDLTAGSYVLICNIVETEASGKTESHYLEGMHTAFTVE